MKKNFLLLCFLCSCFSFAQNSDEEKIQLPELTTTVSGDSVVAGRDAVPDFSKVVPSAGEEKNIMPKLPGEKKSGDDDSAEPVADFFTGENKNVYAQGLVGGGFPGDFIGDISVYKVSNVDPFRIDFSHFSRNGYGKHRAGNGFFDNGTKLYAEKSFRAISSDFTVGGRYDRSGTGLQGQSPNFHDLNSQKVTGCFLFDHAFGDSGFEFFSETESYWYNRYSGIYNDGSFKKQERKSDVVFTQPEFTFSWYYKGFSAGLECNFSYESFVGRITHVDTDDIMRASGTLFTAFENDFVTAFTKGGIAGGTEMGEDRNVIPHFSTGAEVRFPLKSTGKKIVIGVNGGLETRHEEFADLERKYKFATLISIPTESTDWFGNAKLVIPLGNVFTLNSGVEFKKTAYDNGIWEADYETEKNGKVYGFKRIERTLVTTDSGLTFKSGIFTLHGGWRAHWKHVPSNEYRHSIEGTVSIDDEDERWGFSAGAVESVDKKSDKCPDLRASIYYNIRKILRLSLEMQDGIKLFSRKDRKYAGTDYLVRAGSVTFLSRFYF